MSKAGWDFQISYCTPPRIDHKTPQNKTKQTIYKPTNNEQKNQKNVTCDMILVLKVVDKSSELCFLFGFRGISSSKKISMND